VPPVADPGELHGEPSVNKNLPHRPNLDHLRRQAKSLLAALAAGEPEAVSTIRQHLPAAQQLSAAEIRRSNFRLADAQSAIARKTGFASWPQLARHVEQLRALEGVWSFARLEIDGGRMPVDAIQSSRLLIDGDRFRTETPEANYEGVFNINVEAQPHEIDIEFVEGPEAGNWNYGIFRVEEDRLEICLDLNGKPRPAEFRTSPGGGHAYELLTRISISRPPDVNGGTPGQKSSGPECIPGSTAGEAGNLTQADFIYVPSQLLTRLQGNWTAEKLILDGQELPAHMCATGRRTTNNNEIKIMFGGQVIIQALVRVNESSEPVQIDYLHLAGTTKGQVQQGILEWRGKSVCFCMAAPGAARPAEFTSPPGTGRTLSQWKPAK